MTIGKIPAIALFAFAAGCAGIGFFGDGERAVPDEPDEINLDSLGGTLVTFGRFAEYCEANPGFKAQLLECAPVDESMDEFETVWLKPGDIKDGATVCDWESATSKAQAYCARTAGTAAAAFGARSRFRLTASTASGPATTTPKA